MTHIELHKKLAMENWNGQLGLDKLKLKNLVSTQCYFIYDAAPLQGKTCKEKVYVEKLATKKLAMTDKVMTALKEKGEVDSDLGILLPKGGDAPSASTAKAEKPSLEKLLAATKNLKSAYLLFLQALHPWPACL